MRLDFTTLVIDAARLFVSHAPSSARATFLAAAVLGLGVGAMCFYAPLLFNRRFRGYFLQVALASVATLATTAFVVSYAALGYVDDAARVSVRQWEQILTSDKAWAAATFRTAYAAVKAGGLEDFSELPPPGVSGAFIPTAHDASRERAADVYADAACANFAATHPALSRFVWTTPAIPAEVLYADVKRWHRSNANYPPGRAIALVAQVVADRLEAERPRFIRSMRLQALTAFIVAQALVFGTLALVAYREIKVRA